MKFELIDCQYGDMIRVKLGGLFHYGIYVSDDEVIQFGYPPILRDKDKGNIVVVSTSIDVFACSSFVEVGVLDKKEKKEAFSKEEIVSRARNRLGEGGYNILHNNCEHFVYECYFNKKYSAQETLMREKWKKANEGK